MRLSATVIATLLAGTVGCESARPKRVVAPIIVEQPVIIIVEQPLELAPPVIVDSPPVKFAEPPEPVRHTPGFSPMRSLQPPPAPAKDPCLGCGMG